MKRKFRSGSGRPSRPLANNSAPYAGDAANVSIPCASMIAAASVGDVYSPIAKENAGRDRVMSWTNRNAPFKSPANRQLATRFGGVSKAARTPRTPRCPTRLVKSHE